ncbi:MAG: ATP-dependent helicase HrpB [Hyphomicrobiaceae bacterium]|nr:ATP-dependent helicase HrpB [Hyphomicrobiaceae bacterium]
MSGSGCTQLPLPIEAVLGALGEALVYGSNAVLIAPPGAGKTTRVPLALLDAPWRGDGRILVLEPRRIAARAAAERMAQMLGERVGERVGLRARLASRIGPRTRVEVVTEGVFTRMILDDPELGDVACVVFDEFHERSLDADFGLALALDTQAALRPELKILVMSATLEGGRVAGLLGGSAVIESEGRSFPIETRYVGRDPARRIEDLMTDVIVRALGAERGSILAFLPGQGEIRRVEERLAERINDPSVVVAPLFGAMDPAAQDRAIAVAPSGKRKVVLATSIAETSLTIEGVRVVVDCGLSRVPRFEPDMGVTRLETVKASRASLDQRRGRSGRTEPGVCYRLWDEPQTQSLLAFASPEIQSADLAGLVLDCAAWGVADPRTLAWLDAPPNGALMAAREELAALGALDGDGRITAHGKVLRNLPLPPRIAAMLIASAAHGDDAVGDAALIAALLVERGLGSNDTNIARRLEAFRRDRSRKAQDMKRLAEGWARLVKHHYASEAGSRGQADVAGVPGGTAPSVVVRCLAAAYPERIAKARGAAGQFLLANGRAAAIDATDELARAPYLVVAEMQGAAARTRILLAAPASEPDILSLAGDRVVERDECFFDAGSGAVRARRMRRLDALVLSAEARGLVAGDEVAAILADGVSKLGIDRLPWSKVQLQRRDRVAFLRSAEGDEWPDLSDEALSRSAQVWLAPFLSGKTRVAEITAADLGNALDALLPYSLSRRLEAEAPTHFEAPTGHRHPIDYEGAGAPRLSIRVQELFGLREHPAIAGGRLPLTLELLSPAQRPIQVTRDLPGFWVGSWAGVRADMRGRYPKHLWPEDPASALPTARAKPRGS